MITLQYIGRYKHILYGLCIAFFLSSCAFPHRPGYDRGTGTYPSSRYNAKMAKAKEQNKGTNPNPSVSALKNAISPWIGTPYLYGGESRRGTDCSGFVRQIYKSHFKTDLPHSTKQSWSFGKAISKGDLEPGDVVFFGNFIGVSHNGIYVGNNTFAHASSSRGVMYESLDNSYWVGRYQGARRYLW